MRNTIQAVNADRNYLLGSLTASDRERLLPHLEPVTFLLGKVIYEPDERVNYCYFPTSSVVSLLYTTQEGSTAEMGLVGNDGVTGVAVFLGGESTCSRAVVAVAGGAFRLEAKRLQREFAHPGPLQGLLLRYTQALITQISQTAVCNRSGPPHRLRRRCADRSSRAMPLTDPRTRIGEVSRYLTMHVCSSAFDELKSCAK